MTLISDESYAHLQTFSKSEKFLEVREEENRTAILWFMLAKVPSGRPQFSQVTLFCFFFDKSY